jgi:hypothetical protein
MKNFSDLLAIKKNSQIDVSLNLEVIQDNGPPTLSVNVNSQNLFNNVLNFNLELQTKINLTDPFKIEIELSNKQYSSEKETAVIVKNLKIDNFELIPNYVMTFDYINDHNQNTPTYYLGFNGKWILDSKMPFYLWKHQATGQGWLLSP